MWDHALMEMEKKNIDPFFMKWAQSGDDDYVWYDFMYKHSQMVSGNVRKAYLLNIWGINLI